MLPPSPLPPASVDLNWIDEQGIMYLEKLMKGYPLPDDVFGDINPYQYEPSNLPDGFWYFMCSNDRKETALGFWKATGEACEIYKDSIISCWRTTLEFDEVSDPLGQRTKWLMQEYRITMNGLSDKSDLEDNRTLCRIFRCDGEGSCFVAQKVNRNVASAEGNSSLAVSAVPSSGSPSRKDVRREILGKEMVAERLAGLVPDKFDHILSGDYLELDDLADRESLESSSDNSSCISRKSDESFDSLIRDLEDEINKDMAQKASNSKFTVAAHARPIAMVMQPATVASLATEVESKSPAENEVARAMDRNVGPSRSNHEASSSKSRKTNSKEDEESGNKKKPKKRYLCFMPF